MCSDFTNFLTERGWGKWGWSDYIVLGVYEYRILYMRLMDPSLQFCLTGALILKMYYCLNSWLKGDGESGDGDCMRVLCVRYFVQDID